MMDTLTRQKLKNTPVKIIGLRYFNVYGPGEGHKGKMASMVYQLAQKMKHGNRPRIFKYGEQARDQIYVADVVQANLKALAAHKEKSGIYNVGTGRPTNFNEMVTALNAVFGTHLEPEYIDNPYVGKYQDHTQASIEPTKKELGFHPQYDIQKGIRAYFESGML